MNRALFVLFLSSIAVAAPKTQKKPVPVGKEPVGFDRTLTITDAAVASDLRLAPLGQTTTVTFPVDVEVADQGDAKGRMLPPLMHGSSLVLTAREALPAGTTVPLLVTLVDKTQLSLAIVGGSAEFDRFVRVELSLARRAGADNADRLKMQLQDVQAKLDDCLEGGADVGVKKLGAAILRQDLSKPDAFTVEKRTFKSGIDKQNRLLVETHYLFRLFDLTYLVITAENRDVSKSWVLDRAELAAVGDSTSDVRVLSVEQELNAIPPGEVSKMVIAFRMPPLEKEQTFTLKLFEKNGSRHFELADLHF